MTQRHCSAEMYLDMSRRICWRTLPCAMVAWAACALAANRAASLDLVSNGASGYTIVTPDDPTAQEQFAAGELQKYLALMAGAKVEPRLHGRTVAAEPLAVISGGVKLPVSAESKASGRKIIVAVALRAKRAAKVQFAEGEADYDAFALQTDGADLLLIGSNKRAVIYAVYTLLEKHLGCRWLSFGGMVRVAIPGGTDHSTEIEEFVPRKATIAIPELHERHRASLKFRGFSCGGPYFGDMPAQVVDWAMKQKLNYLLVPGGYAGSEWGSLVAKGQIVPRGIILAAGHHSFFLFLPPDKYFKDHPDWFALQAGARKPGGRGGGQFCLSNPEAAKTYRENVLAFAAQHPDVDVLALYPNDGYGWCECPNCKTGIAWEERRQYEATQDLYLKLINPTAVEVKSRFPDKHVMIAAYVNYSQPPAKEKPAAGTDVHYAFFTRNWFTDPLGNAAGPLPVKGYETLTELNRKFIQRWVDRAKEGGGNVILYEYYTGRSAWSGRPYPLMHLIQQELAYFERIGVAGCTVQAGFGAKRHGTNLYVFAKAAWDTKLDVDATLADYYQHRYGKAAPAMAKYFTQMEDNARHLQKYFVRGAEAVAKRDKGLADCQQFLKQAAELADTERATQLVAEEQQLFTAYRNFQLEK